MPFVPDAAKKDMVFSGLVILALVACAAIFGPIGPSGQPDPTIIQTEPTPDFFFLWLYAVLALLPPYIETIAPAHRRRSIAIAASCCAAVLRRHGREELAAPAGRGARRHHDRVLTLGTLTYLGTSRPGRR